MILHCYISVINSPSFQQIENSNQHFSTFGNILIKYAMKLAKKLTSALIILSLMSFTSSKSDDQILKEARRIHAKCLTVDTHCDTPMLLLKNDFDISKRNEAPKSRVDLPRMKEGGLDAMFFAVFTGQKPRTEENYRSTYKLANQMLDSIHSMVEHHPDLVTLALKADDLARIEKTGKRAAYIGMENGFPIGKDLSRVEEFYNRGVRYITLCHSFHNDICDSSSDPAPAEHNGLSNFGRQVVAEMNRLGIMVDVSHASDKSFFDAVEASKAPVIASHSSVRSVCKHDRNMSDEMIRKLAAKGGVIQICLLDDYIKEPDTTTVRYQKEKEFRRIYRSQSAKMSDQERQEFYDKWDRFQEENPKPLPSVKDLVDHIDYVKNLVGVDYVGIGSDFDGGGGLSDCADVSQFPAITLELLKRGYSEEDIRKIWGGNLLRVFREVEHVAGTLADAPAKK